MQDPRNQGQDKIVAVGYSDGKVLMGRYTPEGSVDHEELLQTALAVYPNPADDFIFVSLNGLRTNDYIALYATDGWSVGFITEFSERNQSPMKPRPSGRRNLCAKIRKLCAAH